MTDLEILLEVKTELDRFTKKLAEAIKEQEGNGYSKKCNAAARRGALDLKNELTKLTQSSKYKYYDRFRTSNIKGSC